MIEATMRRRDRRKFWKAVHEAAGNGPDSMYRNKAHPIWGMRAIRDFERINGVEFNPRNSLHLSTVSSMGRGKIMIAHMRDIARSLGTLAGRQ